MTTNTALPIKTLKAHLALNVRDVVESTEFYTRMFGLGPSKVRRGYAKFDVQNPPLNLTLNQSAFGERGALSHLGIQVASTDDVVAVREHWIARGLVARVEEKTDCCHAIQDKAWVHDPDGNAWEVFVVLQDNLPERAGTASSCCAPSDADMSEKIVDAVREQYAGVAGSGRSSEQVGIRAVAEAFGYTPEELSSIPAEANMGLSCGNPTATASLRDGETVLDLGSGGGLDVFLAAQKVGPTGRAIGVDMTPEMVALARRNAAKRLEGGAPDNVAFHLARIDALPLEDASVDVVISNCVINLAPDKPAVFREMARVLKPGGRVAISDIALMKPLPPELGQDVLAYVGCIAGAISIDEYRRGLLEVGFAHVEVVDSRTDLGAYAKATDASGCCSPAISAPLSTGAKALPVSTGAGCCAPAPKGASGSDAHAILAELIGRYDVNEYAASVRVFALKGAEGK
jgi:arsenite methyltransferase